MTNDLPNNGVSTSARRRKSFIFGQGSYELWLRWLDKRSWEPGGYRHSSRRAALVRARSLGLTPDEITNELLARSGAAGDPRREWKVRDDITRFFNLPRVDRPCRASAPIVALDAGLRDGITAGSTFGLADLRALSPIDPPDCEQIIDALFLPWDFVCVGYTEFSFVTKPVAALGGALWRNQFICPQPMTKEKGRNEKGELSFHTLDNCGPWTYLVIEWDSHSATIEEQARMLFHLRDKFPRRLVLVVHSGGESLHGWFRVQDWPNEQREALAAYALRLGACSGTIKNRSQFVRMPGGLRRFRDGRKPVRQVVHYYDAGALP